jgi:hypothetical protein
VALIAISKLVQKSMLASSAIPITHDTLELRAQITQEHF